MHCFCRWQGKRSEGMPSERLLLLPICNIEIVEEIAKTDIGSRSYLVDHGRLLKYMTTFLHGNRKQEIGGPVLL